MRPIAVCLRGIDVGSDGSTSTIQPKRLRLVGFGLGAEPRVDALPAAAAAAVDAVAVALPALGLGGGEVPVEVLLARQDRAPRGRPAGAVPERADRGPPLRVGTGAQRLRARGRTGERHRVHGVMRRLNADSRRYPQGWSAPARRSSTTDMPCAAIEMRNCSSVAPSASTQSRNMSSSLVYSLLHTRRAGSGPAGDDRRVVVVVAELPELGRLALVLVVELGRAGQDRVAPGDERRPRPAAGTAKESTSAGTGAMTSNSTA